MQYYKRNEVESFIRMRFESNAQCAEALGITTSTFSRNLDRLTLNFIQKLRAVGVPIPFPDVKDERVNLIVNEPHSSYDCWEQLKQVKSENYDLQKKIDILENKLKEKKK